MLGRESKQFRLEFGHKGYGSLVFQPAQGDSQLSSGRKQGALASIIAGQAAKNADVGATAGWQDNNSLTNRAYHRPKPSRVATREPADYLVRKRSTNFVLHTSADNAQAHHSAIKSGSSFPKAYRNEFEEKDLVYIPGRGYFVGNDPSKLERDKDRERETQEDRAKRTNAGTIR